MEDNRANTASARAKAPGFTLVELLVVVAIIGVLAAIALPEFGAYWTRSLNARLAADARNAAVAEEAAFVIDSAYSQGDCAMLPAMTLSSGVVCTAELATCTNGTTGY